MTPVRWIAEVGWLGVSCFFILSGFVLMWGYDPATPASRFLLRRLFRIYPMHLLGLAVALLFFATSGHPRAGYIGTPAGFLANVFLVHGWIPWHPEIRQAWNGVSWTLSCEFLFYLLAPFTFALMLKARSPVLLLAGLAAGWLVLLLLALVSKDREWFAALDILFYHPAPRFFEFALGACGALLLRSGYAFRATGLSVALIVIPVALYCLLVPDANDGQSSAVLNELAVPGFFLLIVSLAQMDADGQASWMHNPRLVFLGEASYALYMTHALVLFAFSLMCSRLGLLSQSSGVLGDLGTAAFAAVAIEVSVVAHRDFEAPAREYLSRRFAARMRAPGAARAASAR